ncbi:MAG: HEAT repeat domain-containing protein [Phycisphaerales bacterium]|nr:MAG: HEAT repeat domain-containing protein [Phycisphaerales bacterium]
MKTKCTISKSLALLLLCSWICFGAGESSQDDAVGIILEILRGGDQEMQAVAIAMVKDMPGEQVTEALARELPNLSGAGQVQLLSALGDRADVAALPAVVAAAESQNPSVRIAALRALGQLGDASSVDLLARAAAAGSGNEQKAARASLYRLRGAQVDQVIVAAIPEAKAETKVELIRSVGQRNIRAGVGALLKTARDADRTVRTESLRTLKIVAGPENLPVLVELLMSAQSSSDRNEAQKTVVAVAHKIEDRTRQAASVLAVLPSVKQNERRCLLLGILGKIGDSTALPVLTAALKEADPQVQVTAIRALAEWPTPEPLGNLLKVAQNSGDKVHRILALRGFVRLLGLKNERPAEETAAMYKKAMILAPDVGEKRRVLSGLANTRSLAALQMAADYLEDQTLCEEAGFAAVKIAGGIHADLPNQAKDVLRRVVQVTKSDSLREQAQEVMNSIGQPVGTQGRPGEEENR